MIPIFFGGPNQTMRIVKLRSGNLYYISSLMDLWIMKETVLDRQYEGAGVPLQDGWNVVDIGAAFGDYSVWAAKQVPHGRVLAVEPFIDSIKLLRENIALNKVTNITVVESAVGSLNGTVNLELSLKSPVRNSTAKAKELRAIVVKSVTLETLLEELGIQKCQYLKIDCEGAEYDILFNTPIEVLKRVERICMEIHDGITRFSRQDMIEFLQKKGYSVKLTPNPVHQEMALIYAEKTDLRVLNHDIK
jgi:FkbM family methyltransferase